MYKYQSLLTNQIKYLGVNVKKYFLNDWWALGEVLFCVLLGLILFLLSFTQDLSNPMSYIGVIFFGLLFFAGIFLLLIETEFIYIQNDCVSCKKIFKSITIYYSNIVSIDDINATPRGIGDPSRWKITDKSGSTISIVKTKKRSPYIDCIKHIILE